MTASLRSALAEFDGKAMTLLGEAQAAFAGQAGYHAALVALAGESQGHAADGATWLLKSALESGAQLSPPLTARLWDTLDHLPTWAAQLHMCQSIRFLTIAPSQAPELARWLDGMAAHSRPFIRAWALDGLAHLAHQHEPYRAALAAALTRAEQDEAASVRARARNLRGQG